MRIRVCDTHELPSKGFKALEAGGKALLVGLIDGRPFAWLDRCPHAGVPLRMGRLAGNELTCGRHGWTFDIGTGCSVPDNPAFKLSAIPIVIEGEDVLLDVPDNAPGNRPLEGS